MKLNKNGKILVLLIPVSMVFSGMGPGLSAKDQTKKTKGAVTSVKSSEPAEASQAEASQVGAPKSEAPEKNISEKTKLKMETASEPDNNPKSMMKMDATAKPGKKPSKFLSEWLQKLKERINRTKAKHNKIVAVASVRGAQAKDPAPLYWKGKQGQAKVDIEELKSFEAAIDLANAGKTDEARSSLESFISAHPKSPLVADAKETLTMLSDTE